MNASDFINPCALAERNAVIAQLIDQRDALLAACKGLLEEFGDERIPDPSVVINARAAIALAEGKEAV